MHFSCKHSTSCAQIQHPLSSPPPSTLPGTRYLIQLPHCATLASVEQQNANGNTTGPLLLWSLSHSHARQSNSATCSHGGYMHTSGSRDVRCLCSMSRGERDIFYRVIGFATNSVDGSDPHAGFCDKHDTLTNAPRRRT